jgi:hypothetical protein
MQYKLSVALQLEVAHHFIERCAGERSMRFEPPATFGATKTLKTLLLNPYQSPAHGCQCRCAPTPSDRMPGTRLPSGDEAFSFLSRVLPDCSRKPSPIWGGGGCVNGWSLPVPIWKVCRASYVHGRFLFERPPFFGCDPSF